MIRPHRTARREALAESRRPTASEHEADRMRSVADELQATQLERLTLEGAFGDESFADGGDA